MGTARERVNSQVRIDKERPSADDSAFPLWRAQAPGGKERCSPSHACCTTWLEVLCKDYSHSSLLWPQASPRHSGQTLTVLFNAVPAQPPLGTVEEQLHQGPQGRASSQHMLLVPGAAVQTLLPQAALALQPARPLILAAPKPISEHPARLF